MTYNKEIENIEIELQKLYKNSKKKEEWSTNSKSRIIPMNSYKEMFKGLGYKISKPYHLHGIGNNNEYKITKRIALDNGYETEVIIGSFKYNYDLYANHVFVSFFDKDDNLVYKEYEYIYCE